MSAKKAIAIIDMPECCGECPFCGDIEEVHVGVNLYKKISRCIIAGEDVEDPWRGLDWQMENKEDWCPLKEYHEEV